MKHAHIALLFILAVAVPATFSNWGLTESSEARYAQISKEMFISGDIIHPKLLGINHYHKPPLTYYLTALGYFIFGVNEYGARFFLQIALLFQLFFVFRIAQILYNNKALSLSATLLYFSYPIVQTAAKNLTTDAYLTAFIFSSIYFFLKYYRKGRSVKNLYFFYISCGLAFLTKGPVGILPQAVLAICYLYLFKIKVVFEKRHLLPLILGVIISMWWFILLLYQNGKFLHYFTKYQLVDRVASDAFKRSKPFWYYFITMPLLGLPAILYLPVYFRTKLSSYRIKNTISGVLMITLIILFLCFSFSSSKLVLYVLPLYLFISLLSARRLSLISLSKQKLFENISLSFYAFLFLFLMALCFIPNSFDFPKLPILLLGCTGISGILYCKFARFNVTYIKAPFINSLNMAVLTCIFPFIMKANDLKINSVKSVSQFIKFKANNKEMGNIVVFNYLLPSLSFYTDQKIFTIDNGNPQAIRETEFDKYNGEWNKHYIKLTIKKDSSRLASLLSKPNSFLIEQQSHLLPDSLLFLKKAFKNKAIMEKWIVYY